MEIFIFKFFKIKTRLYELYFEIFFKIILQLLILKLKTIHNVFLIHRYLFISILVLIHIIDIKILLIDKVSNIYICHENQYHHKDQ